MSKKLTPELEKLKEEYDFLHKRIGELEWEIATIFYDKKAIFESDEEKIYAQLNNYRENMGILIERIKDEVRKAGLELGIPEYLVFRQPFPGPGLGIRIIGEVTEEKVRIVQDADFIYREEIDKAAEAYKVENGKEPSWMPNQYFAALTNMRSVGVMGDFRTYDYAVALRAVKTIDFMTAESAEIPYEVLNRVMNRVINEVKGVNRVFYDLTSKPPGTIEFE